MLTESLYVGRVRHRRFSPHAHAFCYSVFMFCFDLKHIHSTLNSIKYVSVEHFNWFSFYRKHHLFKKDHSLDQEARELIAAQHHDMPQGRIFLLTNLACLGYCINPISIYFVFNDKKTETLDYLILEVTNTPWGEKKCYVIKNNGSKTKNLSFQKKLHVSPFMAMDQRYHLNIKIKYNKVILHLENFEHDVKKFDATLSLNTHQGTAQQLFYRFPMITYKIAWAIYWQALKIWLKGNPFFSHPKNQGTRKD